MPNVLLLYCPLLPEEAITVRSPRRSVVVACLFSSVALIVTCLFSLNSPQNDFIGSSNFADFQSLTYNSERPCFLFLNDVDFSYFPYFMVVIFQKLHDGFLYFYFSFSFFLSVPSLYNGAFVDFHSQFSTFSFLFVKLNFIFWLSKLFVFRDRGLRRNIKVSN